MAQSYYTLPSFTFPRRRNVSEDADADTVSMGSESSSPSTSSAGTALQVVDIGDKDSQASPNHSKTPSLDTALTRHRRECLPTVPQAGYFVFPDPFSSRRRASSSRERIRSSAATSSEDEGSTSEDELETEDHGSRLPENVSLGQGAEQDPAASAKEAKQFLPLLKDEPNYPRNPTLDSGLEKINKRLRSATARSEEQSTQSNERNPILRIHPALRQAEPQSANDNEALAPLRAEAKQLKAEVRALEQSAACMDSRYAEVIENVRMNQERIVGGWARMRHELFQVKVMQEQLRRRMNMEHNMEGRW